MGKSELHHRRRTADQARQQLARLFDWRETADAPKSAIRESWLRSALRVDTSLSGAPVDDRYTASDHWNVSSSRLAALDVLVEIDELCEREELVAGLTDTAGQLVWTCGHRSMRGVAENVGFLPGGRWDEGSTGTNALGLALRLGKPVEVFANEHWLGRCQEWVCYSAPVYEGRRIVGAFDLSTDWRKASPTMLTETAALARRLGREMLGVETLSQGSSANLWLKVLGPAQVSYAGNRLRLRPRQLEILTVLALVGEASLDQLHAYIYDDQAIHLTTPKAEISRLRGTLEGAIESRPYRLSTMTWVDILELLDDLEAGRLSTAAALYQGQLLPWSEAPVIVDRRHALDVALRTALLKEGTAAELLRYAAVHPHDVAVLERAIMVADEGDPVHSIAVGRLAAAMG